MDSEPSGGNPKSGRRSTPRAVDDLVAEYLDRLNSGGDLDPFQVLAEHPELGPEVLEKLETFVDLGGDSRAEPVIRTIGDYTLRRQIGRGGMGVVYEAWENSMNRAVALKVLPAGVAADPRRLTRFVREAQVAGNLHHPNVVPVYGMGVKEKTPYFAMELVEGETLAQVLAANTESEPEAETQFGLKGQLDYYAKLARAFAEVAEGLQHAHSKGIIHRDIKPSNLILDRDGRLRILDFGLARLEGQESLTLSGDFLGTPLYMSPEQARARKVPIDHRTDVYSLGATLYEVLAGRPPFQGKDHQDTLSQIIERDPVEPRSLDPRVPKDLETVALRCLRKDAGDRYGTAEALGQDLRRFVRGDPIEARPQAGWEKFVRRLRRHQGRILAATLVLLLLLASGVLVQGQYRDARKRSEDQYRQAVLEAIMKLQVGQMLINTESVSDPNVDQYRQFTRADFRLTSGGGGLSPVKKAVEELGAAIARLPRRPDAHYYLARCFLLLGRAGDAATALEKALQVDAGFTPARILREILCQQANGSGKLSEGEDRAGQAEGMGFEDAWRTGYVATSARKWREAADAYTRIIDLQKGGPEPYLGASLEAYLGRGYALLEAKDLFHAIEDFITVKALWPNLVEPALLKGKAYALMGHLDLAEAVFQEAYQGAAFSDEVARVLAIIYCDSIRDFEKALSWARQVKDAGYGLTTQAGFLNILGRYEEAAAAAKGALALDPKNVQATIHLGTALVSTGRRLKDCLPVLQRAIDLDRGDPIPHQRLAVAYDFQGMWEKAYSEYRTAARLNPFFLGAQVGVIGCLVVGGSLDQALALTEELLKAAPEAVMILSEKGRVLARLGRFEESQKVFKIAVKSDPIFYLTYAYWARTLEFQGKEEEAIPKYQKALELNWVPNGRLTPGVANWSHGGIARHLEKQGRLEEALSEYCQAIGGTPLFGDPWLPRLMPLLLRLGDSPAARALLDGLADRLEEFVDQDYPCVFETMALISLHGEKRRSLARAMEWIEKARRFEGCDGPGIESLTAEHQFQSGKKAEAVRTLEKALRHPSAKAYLGEQLAGYRRNCSPDLVSYGSIDSALAWIEPGDPGEARLLEGLQSVAGGEAGARRIAYLQSCLLERSGSPGEAARRLESLRKLDPLDTDLLLRHALCLRAAGDPSLAAKILRGAIEKGGYLPQEIWYRWATICLADLGLRPEEMKAEFPDHQEGPGTDLSWLLGKLSAGEGIYLDCGADQERISPAGTWGEDRFHCGGYGSTPYRDAVKNTADGALYHSHRSFPADQLCPPAYRLPLPRSTYRVTLYFAEVYLQTRGLRRFDVRIEGQELLDYEPLAAGFATAEQKTFEVEVKDGMLDIEFVRRVGDPMISAIEILRIE